MNTSTKRTLTLEQWLVALEDHLPAAYMRAYSAHLESLYSDGATVGEAFVYARAYLLAPTVCPTGMERLHAMPVYFDPFSVEFAALTPGE